MTVTDELIAILGYKLEGEGNLRKFQRGLDQAEKEARASASRFAAIGSMVGGKLGAALGIGATAAFTRQAYVSFAQFERQMTRVGITAGASATETKEATLQVQRLSQNYSLPIDAAVAGLDTLVSSGMNLREAMSFLPSVLMTAQAAGASTQDIANTAQKASSALKIEAGQMQEAFDIMVTGGKAGQFELKDMAQYIPGLGSAFAALGYQGLPGLRTLIATLQTLRLNTGTAGAAATQAENIFQKMFSNETASNFKKFGVNLPAALKEAKKNGEGLLEAFVRITSATIKGDLTKLPQLINDTEFQAGIRTLLTSGSKFQEFVRLLGSSDVKGAALEDFGRVADDTSAKIQRLSNSWQTFMKAIGEDSTGPINAAVGFAGSVIDRLAGNLEKNNAVQRAFDKAGLSPDERRAFLLRSSADDIDRVALAGGYVPRSGEKTVQDHLASSQGELTRLQEEDAKRREAAARELERLRNASDDNTGAPTGGIFSPRQDIEEKRQQRIKDLEGQLNAIDPAIAKMAERIEALKSLVGDSGLSEPPPPASVPLPLPRPASVPLPTPRPTGAGGQRVDAAPIQVPDWAKNILQNIAEIGRQMEGGGAESVVNDSRTFSATQNVQVSAPVTVSVQQATQAPAAVGNAVSRAIDQGVRAQPSRMQQGPVQ